MVMPLSSWQYVNSMIWAVQTGAAGDLTPRDREGVRLYFYKKRSRLRFTMRLADVSLHGSMAVGTVLTEVPAAPRRAHWPNQMSTRMSGGEDSGRGRRSSGRSRVRPTSDRVRSAIFSIIGGDAVDGVQVLDLYAGIGGLGIEALARGASRVDFVEVDPRRCRAIREALRRKALDGRARVYRARVERALSSLPGRYGLVFIDPPYDLDPWDSLMESLDAGDLLQAGATVIAEHFHKLDMAPRYGGLIRQTARRYGDTTISIYKTAEADG